MNPQHHSTHWEEMLAISHPEEDLSPTEYAALQEHLAGCAQCVAQRDRYILITERLRSMVTAKSIDASSTLSLSTPCRYRVKQTSHTIGNLARNHFGTKLVSKCGKLCASWFSSLRNTSAWLQSLFRLFVVSTSAACALSLIIGIPLVFGHIIGRQYTPVLSDIQSGTIYHTDRLTFRVVTANESNSIVLIRLTLTEQGSSSNINYVDYLL